MPKTRKQMRRFLGCAVFFSKFVPNYSEYTAPLVDMIKDNFDWEHPATWKENYVRAFEIFKEKLIEATSLFYPDYELPWYIRADSSEVGVIFVLLQEAPPTEPGGEPVLQPILFGSAKFSEAATRWSTYAQEAYAMFYAFQKCEYYIRAKPFVYQGDHANLQWMETCTDAKVIRWRVFLHNFVFKFWHISGKKNIVADGMSRMFNINYSSPNDETEVDLFEFLEDETTIELCFSMFDLMTENIKCTESSELYATTLAEIRRSQRLMPQHVKEYLSEEDLQKKALSGPDPELIPEPDVDISPQLEQSPQVEPDPQPSQEPSLIPQDQLQEEVLPVRQDDNQIVWLTRKQMLDYVHGGRSTHRGNAFTIEMLNKHFPGHGISYQKVLEYRQQCPTCQKNDHTMNNVLFPITRNLMTTGPRMVVGIDYLSLWPDKFGNIGLYLMKDHFTRLVRLFPVSSRDAASAAMSVFSYCTTYGKFKVLISDPGSELTSKGMEMLNSWFGIHHRLSLVDRHESNGVEGNNKQFLRHLRDLIADSLYNKELAAQERIGITKVLEATNVADSWSSPQVMEWIAFIMNSYDKGGAGYSAFDLTFGSEARPNFTFPDGPLSANNAPEFLRALNENLRSLKAASARHQQQVIAKRASKDTYQNMYQPGDYVLLLRTSLIASDKHQGAYLGPYVVRKQSKNDVECQHMATHVISTFHIERLKLFRGSQAEAKALAAADADQHMVQAIISYRGDPLKRTSMEFLVRYADGDVLWLPYSLDIFKTIAYEDFVSSKPELHPMLFDTKGTQNWLTDVKAKPIRARKGQSFFVDIRAFGAHWYQALPLPNLHEATYMVKCTFGAVVSSKHIKLSCPTLQRELTVDKVFVAMYASTHEIPPSQVTVVDDIFVRKYPDLLTTVSPIASVASYQHLVGKRFLDDGKTYDIIKVDTDRQHNIVARCTPIVARGRAKSKTVISYHVEDALDLVKAYSSTSTPGGGRKGNVAQCQLGTTAIRRRDLWKKTYLRFIHNNMFAKVTISSKMTKSASSRYPGITLRIVV
jgi:hypothetical protein